MPSLARRLLRCRQLREAKPCGGIGPTESPTTCTKSAGDIGRMATAGTGTPHRPELVGCGRGAGPIVPRAANGGKLLLVDQLYNSPNGNPLENRPGTKLPKKNNGKRAWYQERSHANSSHPSVIGASSDITRNSEPPSVTPTGYTHVRDCKTLGSQSRA